MPGSGLGKEAAIALAKRGHKVYATVHYEEEIEKLSNYAKENNLDMEVFKLDILLEEDRNLVLNYDIDTFIANAAIGDSGSVAEIRIDRIKNVFETNVFANIELSQLVIKRMIEKGIYGKLIFLSSLVGRVSIPFLSPYCASKSALEAFIESLKYELEILPGSKIQVCLIEPGAYATGFNKINYEKKYTWMNSKSYFKDNYDELKKYEDKIWEKIELKDYDNIIDKYVKAVEDEKPKFRYTAPKGQALAVEIARIFKG
ncbi:MAG: SDR family NAD(P)-dependent oxidoreductase [Clostridia bacterium]|nr:SDR family NAD(P)-dependent oxidoreductase [Clostridia bacterium]MDD4376330.1 SDR family NAD(P)-dependent oxidoreductase [Clostridia bacterium]